MRFTKGNAPVRGIQSAAETRVPGFVGVICAVNESNRTCDLWRQGSPYVVRGVKYSVSLRNPPEYVKVRSAVYVRFPNGNRMQPEVAGPATTLPTVKAGLEQLPATPTPTNSVMTGMRVIQSAKAGQSVVVTTGTIRWGATVLTAAPAGMGEDLNAKVTGASPGIAKFGQLGYLGDSYVYVPCSAAPTGVNYRYDSIEIGSNMVVDYRIGEESTDPVPADPQVDHIVLGYILRRPDQNTIYNSDISVTNQSRVSTIYLLTATASKSDLLFGDSSSVITVTVSDYSNRLIQGINVTWRLMDGNGSVSPSNATTDSSGVCSFTYTRGNLSTDSSPLIQFEIVGDQNSFYQVVITLYDSNGLAV
jgi:Bacterial Ig-like domain (group 1)